MKKSTLIVAIAGLFMSEVIWQIYRKYRHLGWNVFRKWNAIEKRKYIAEVLFFGDDSAFCRTHLNSKKSCNKPNCAVMNFSKLEKYLNSAKSTIDVCLYFFTSHDLCNAIIKAYKRGVVVRIIIDATMAQHDDCQALAFRKASVKVRTRYSKDLMHHKFVIIDNDILITGSANWTMQAFFGNFENVIVINYPVLVKEFIKEFERLWEIYDKDVEESDIFQLQAVERIRTMKN